MKMFKKIKGLSFKIFLRNLFSLMKYDILKEIRDKQSELKKANNQISVPNRKILEDNLLKSIQIFYDLNPNPEFEIELKYITDRNKLEVFPYKLNKSLEFIYGDYDQVKNLPFVWHEDKKLYFPQNWSLPQAKETYKYFIEEENILGGNFKEKSPHQYLSESVNIKDSDIVIDVGAAEALFSLHVIDKVKKVIIIESDNDWIEALKATFEKFSNKVHIINKRISDIDSVSEIKLETCLSNEKIESLFIKIDIEGDEKKIIQANKSLLMKYSDVRLSCCTYHNKEDAKEIESLLKEYGYHTEFSDGYMIFSYDKSLSIPYFRKGIIRGRKQVVY